MSKAMTPLELEAHINSSIANLSKTLHDLRNSTIAKDQEKAKKVAYWINDYSNHIRNEDRFSSYSLPVYKYRDILSVDFGFRLGSELGGRHYAVVLDKNNPKSSDVITVIPLVSLKENFKERPYNVKLDGGVYTAFEEKLNKYIDGANKLLKEANELSSKYETPELPPEEKLSLQMEFKLKVEAAKRTLKQCDEILEQIKQLKKGTVANINQVVTISKRRIHRPAHQKDILYGIRISSEEMALIENAFKDLYIKKK